MKTARRIFFPPGLHLLILCFLITGCTSNILVRYSEPEVKLIPPVSYSRAFGPGALLIIRTKDSTVTLRVKRYENNDRLIGIDAESGRELTVAIRDIREIEQVREERPSKKRSPAVSGEDLAEVAIYAPLVPVGAVWPVVGGAAGLDAKANSTRRRKALLIYGGMTGDELLTYVGEPQQRYRCNDDSEVWAYKRGQVLDGGEFMFIFDRNRKVYFTSYRFLQKENCSLIEDNNP